MRPRVCDMRAPWLVVALVAAATLSLVPPCTAVAPKPKASKVVGGPDVPAHPEDIPYIKCQVCELLAKNAWKQVEDMKAESPIHQADEMKVIEKMEKITTSWKPEGEWIAKTDLVKDGDKLLVKEMDKLGNCLSECKTVQQAAQRIMADFDTDVAEALVTGKSKDLSAFTKWLCRELTTSCAAQPPPLPEGWDHDEAFDVRREGDQNIDAIIGGLADFGLANDHKMRQELLEKLGYREPVDEDRMETMQAAMEAAMRQAEREEAAKKAASAGKGWKEVEANEEL